MKATGKSTWAGAWKDSKGTLSTSSDTFVDLGMTANLLP